jgi:hypothetical protein
MLLLGIRTPASPDSQRLAGRNDNKQADHPPGSLPAQWPAPLCVAHALRPHPCRRATAELLAIVPPTGQVGNCVHVR